MPLDAIDTMTGYLHSGYAQSLSEFGEPRLLPKSHGWILERTIPGYNSRDAMGCYPLFTCVDWSELYEDMEDLGTKLVSLSVVTDPFGTDDIVYLRECFKDLVLPFKEHFVVDLRLQMTSFVSAHHRYYARKALRSLVVENCPSPIQFLNEWVKLYGTLIERHIVRGISAFSYESFARQFEIPGLVLFRAVHRDQTVGMTLWYVQADSAYWHLGAYSDVGYRLGTSFGLLWSAIEYFAANKFRRLNLGSGAGVQSNSDDGLARFKRGWSTGTRTAYLCGRIFDWEKYSEIMKAKADTANNYFPAYRKGEFA